jgi:drug/metabolite transporter (DMT)-like permease
LIAPLFAQASRGRYYEEDDYYDYGEPLDHSDPINVFGLLLLVGIGYVVYRALSKMDEFVAGRAVNASLATLAASPLAFLCAFGAWQVFQLWRDLDPSFGSVAFALYVTGALGLFIAFNAWAYFVVVRWAWKRVKE